MNYIGWSISISTALSSEMNVFIRKKSIFGTDIQLFKSKIVTHYEVSLYCILLVTSFKSLCKLWKKNLMSCFNINFQQGSSLNKTPLIKEIIYVIIKSLEFLKRS